MPHLDADSRRAALELSPILQPLAPIRDRVLVAERHDQQGGRPLPAKATAIIRARQTAFLTGAHAQKHRRQGDAQRRRLDGSDRRAASSAGDAAGVARAVAGVQRPRRASARTATAAPTAGRSPGATPRRRCRWRPTRARCSSACSARATAPSREARLRRIQKDRSILDSVTDELAGLQPDLGRGDRSKLCGIPRLGARHRAAHSEGREPERPGAARRDAAGGDSRPVRGVRQAHVRPDGARVPGGPDARRHVPVRPREERPHLPRDRRARSAPPDVAPPERAGEARAS